MLSLATETAGSTIEQPIQFNHSIHAGQLAIPCVKCHMGVEDRARAGFPPEVFCAACHVVPLTKSPEEAKLIKLLEAGKPLAWKAVTRLSDYVFFSHRRHVKVGNIDCEACHGAMAQRTAPIKEPMVDFTWRPGMLRCLACHDNSGNPYAQTECVDCHR